MSLMPAPGMSATAVERAATMAARIVAAGTTDCLAVRRIFWRGEKHLPKREGRDAGENQQKDANMHPTGRVHQGLLPRPGCQIHSTERT